MAAKKLEAMQDGWKSDYARTGLLAAVALSTISEALPGILAVSLRQSLSREETARIALKAIQASLEEGMPALSLPEPATRVTAPPVEAVSVVPEVAPEPEPEPPVRVAALNFSSSLPD